VTRIHEIRDLFLLSLEDVRDLIAEYENDLTMLSILAGLETALENGDESLHFEMLGELSDELVLKRGVS
jgi:hypothetical protein